MRYDAIVIGGGFYGVRLALTLRRSGRSVILLERESRILERASLVNQARVHGGYHYPRSILTSLRSRANYARFLREYGDCAFERFEHYYAIARGGKITAAQFTEFCRRIGAPIAPAPAAIVSMFDETRIEGVYAVEECAFDASSLRRRLTGELELAGVRVVTSAEVTRVEPADDGAQVEWSGGAGAAAAVGPLVLNCTYSGLNDVLCLAHAARIPMKRELTEMALVEPPPELGGIGVTVMDGPYFSLMPYPSRGSLYTLSHVRYTPHCAWEDDRPAPAAPATRFPHMIRDAARYLPAIRTARYVESLWEVKALMPRSEQDDSRPILFRETAEVRGLYSVLGAKIDSVYDVEERLSGVLG